MSGKTLSLGFAGVLASLLVSDVPAADWPQFRGVNRDGFWNETGLMKRFPEEGLKIRWRRPVGRGWASPVIAKGRVFVFDVQLAKPEARERIQRFDEATGEILWAFDYEETYPEWAFIPEHGGGPASTPAVDDGRVFAVGCNGKVHCLSVEDGSPVWKRDLRDSHEIRDLQCRPSPLVDGDKVIVFTGARPGASVVAFDKRTGRELWKALDDRVSNSSPVIVEAGGARQLIVWTDDSLASLNPATGAVWWREPMTTSNNDSIPTPVVQGNRLLVSGLMLELESGRPEAKVLWPGTHPVTKRILSNTSTPVLDGDHVYSAKSNGELVCLAAATGKLVWATNTVTEIGNGAGINITWSPEAAWLFNDRGELIRAQLTPEGYREEARAKLIEPTAPFGRKFFAWAPPAYANGCVFVRNGEVVLCASLKAVGASGD